MDKTHIHKWTTIHTVYTSIHLNTHSYTKILYIHTRILYIAIQRYIHTFIHAYILLSLKVPISSRVATFDYFSPVPSVGCIPLLFLSLAGLFWFNLFTFPEVSPSFAFHPPLTPLLSWPHVLPLLFANGHTVLNIHTFVTWKSGYPKAANADVDLRWCHPPCHDIEGSIYIFWQKLRTDI